MIANWRHIVTSAACVCLLAVGCGEEDRWVGVMSDYSYAGQVTTEHTKLRDNARGRPTSVSQFEGKFVWSDYAAPWCPPCIPQSHTIRRLQNAYKDRVVFLTVMTSESSDYRSIPDASTARKWAARFRLNPDHVVAAEDQWGRLVPSHMLFSPQGQTLFRFDGQMRDAHIKEVLTARMREWDEWRRTGQMADWMREE